MTTITCDGTAVYTDAGDDVSLCVGRLKNGGLGPPSVAVLTT